MRALALTEHGNTSSHVGLEKAALKAGIKPIFGLEAYTALHSEDTRKMHLTILAATEEGYRNLNRVTSQSWQDFYRYPTVYGSTLRQHNEGLIVLSGCSDSLLACSLLGGKQIAEGDASPERARQLAARMKEMLGDRFYLECQMFPELERTRQINAFYEELGRKLGIPLVATSDVHTVREGQHEIRALLHAAGRGNNTIAQQLSSWEYEVPDFIPTSDKWVFERAMGSGLSRKAAQAACAATYEIADRCSVSLPKASRFRYPVKDPIAELWQWLREGWAYRVAQGNRRMVDNQAQYVAQINREMELIVSKDFVSYFLMASDLIKFAKDNGIAVGPGRGSSASSVVCYLLRITEPDPLQFPLCDFSRFIDPTREDLPDIDTDFDDSKRHLVREYAAAKYGADNTGNIATFTKYKGKNSLIDVGRVYNIPRSDLEVVKGMIIERSGGDSRADAALADTFETFPSAKAMLEKHPALSQAMQLEGNYRGMSVHAAGLVISELPIAQICAMYTREDKKSGELLTSVSVNKYDAEYLGLMKMDLLGLSTMGSLALMLDLSDMTLEELYRLPYDDPETIAAFKRADVVGVFQFEGRATRLVCRNVQPDNFLDLIDINALSRPGPLFSGTTSEYTDVKHGKREPTQVHPIIDRIAQGTRGQIIYQEQILHALADFGGLSVKRVHEIRRIISQKLGEAQFNTSAEDFATNAMKLHGVTREKAMEVWGRVVTSASYAFVYSHSLVYTIIAYWCMWMKVHRPAAFYTSQLQKLNKEKWYRLIRDAEKHGVKVRGVTPGLSRKTWSIAEDGSVVAGWLQLNGVGEVTAERIAVRDAAGEIACPDDLLKVPGIGPVTLSKFREQMESTDPFGLEHTRNSLNKVREAIRRRRLLLRYPTVTSDHIQDMREKAPCVWIGKVRVREYKDIIEDERAKTGDDLETILARVKHPELATTCVLHGYDDGDEDVYLRIPRFEFPKFKEGLEQIELNSDVVHVVANRGRGSFGAALYVRQLAIIDPDDDEDED